MHVNSRTLIARERQRFCSTWPQWPEGEDETNKCRKVTQSSYSSREAPSAASSLKPNSACIRTHIHDIIKLFATICSRVKDFNCGGGRNLWHYTLYRLRSRLRCVGRVLWLCCAVQCMDPQRDNVVTWIYLKVPALTRHWRIRNIVRFEVVVCFRLQTVREAVPWVTLMNLLLARCRVYIGLSPMILT